MRIQDWHARYQLQALWTDQLRRHMIGRLGMRPGSRVLETGFGTGALFPWLQKNDFNFFGIDQDHEAAMFASKDYPAANLSCCRVEAMSLADDQFDLTFCHYFMLWIEDPLLALKEMLRVTKKGGIVAAFAEPDYSGRIDYPQVAQKIGELQNRSLALQGVNLQIGRRLGSCFRESGLKDVRVGLLAGEWAEPKEDAFEFEWNIIAHDLGSLIPNDEIATLHDAFKTAWLDGKAMSFIPTFYATGIK